jgi:hypothetical protein
MFELLHSLTLVVIYVVKRIQISETLASGSLSLFLTGNVYCENMPNFLIYTLLNGITLLTALSIRHYFLTVVKFLQRQWWI